VSRPGPDFLRPTAPDGPNGPPVATEPPTVETQPPVALAAPTPAERPPAPAHAQPPGPRRKGPLVAAGLVAVVVAGGLGGAVATGLIDRTFSPGPTLVSAAPAPAGPGGLDAAAAAVLPSVVSVEVRGPRGAATGSGFAFDSSGHVMTNAHVVAGGGTVSVVYSDGRRVAAQLIGSDPTADVAVLGVPTNGAPPPLTLRDPSTLRVGEQVLAVGSPLGLAGTVTAGIVSAVDRETGLGDSRNRQTAIQTDAPINPGNSGGPLIDTAGRVVGMNTAIASLGPGNIGIGFAIPADRAAQVATRLINQ